MVILPHSKLKMSRRSVNNPQLATNSKGLPHNQFQIKNGIWADLVRLFSPVLSPVLAGTRHASRAGEKSYLHVYTRDMFLQRFYGARESQIFLVTFGSLSVTFGSSIIIFTRTYYANCVRYAQILLLMVKDTDVCTFVANKSHRSTRQYFHIF